MEIRRGVAERGHRAIGTMFAAGWSKGEDMEINRELPTARRRAAQQTGFDGSDALDWRELLEGAADEIERLHGVRN